MGKMFKIFYLFRYVSWIAIISSLLGSILMFITGAVKTYYAFHYAFVIKIFGQIPPGKLANLKTPADVATIYLVKSIDAFLIALVLFIFAYGVYWIFIAEGMESKRKDPLKSIRISSIGHLKNILAEVIIIILFVLFLEVELINAFSPRWEILILPISILLLSVSVKFLDLRHEKGKEDNE